MEIAKVSCKSFPKLWSLFQPSASVFPPPTERPHTHVFLLAFPKFRSCRLAFWLEASFGRLFLHLLFENYCCIVLKKGCNCSCTFPLPRSSSLRLVLPTISLLFLVFCLCFMAYMGTTYVLSAFWRIALTDYKWNAAWRRPILPPFLDFLRSRAKKWKFVLLLFSWAPAGERERERAGQQREWAEERQSQRERKREREWVGGWGLCMLCTLLGGCTPPFFGPQCAAVEGCCMFHNDDSPSSWCCPIVISTMMMMLAVVVRRMMMMMMTLQGIQPSCNVVAHWFSFFASVFRSAAPLSYPFRTGENFFPGNRMHFLCAACRQCDRQRVEKGVANGFRRRLCGLVWRGGWCVVYRVFACIERIHLACLRLAEKSGKEITDDKEMSENSFQPALQPPRPPAPFSAVVFHSISLFSAFYYDQSFLAWHIQPGCGYNLPAFCYPLPPFLRFFLYLSNLLPGHHPCQWLLGFILLLFVEFFVFWGSHNLNSNEISYLLFFFCQQFFIRISMLSCGSFL